MAPILILECMQEISSFNPVVSDYRGFDCQRGDEMRVQAGLNTAVGGAMDAFSKHLDLPVVPLFSARSGSAGPLNAASWDRLKADILATVEPIKEPIGGIYVSLHGAMAAENEFDPEGALLAALRQSVGWQVPIVISMDLHGILTRKMLSHINGVIAYHTYPHVDFAETGARAADLLMAIMRGDITPVIARVVIPALVRGDQLVTETGCYGDRIRDLQELEKSHQILAGNLLIGNPFTDVPELCSQVVVMADGDADFAGQVAVRVARDFWQQRARMQADLVSVETAIAQAKTTPGPVLFTDAADATSSGASGDSAELLFALLDADYPGRVLAPLVDQPAAQQAHAAGAGATIEVALGGSLDNRFTRRLVTARVALLTQGLANLETSGHKLDAGPSAVLIVGNLTIVVMSQAVSLFDRALFFAHDCNPKAYDLIIVKSPYCEYHMFDQWAALNCNVDAIGATSADVANLGHKTCQRPIYPLDQDFQYTPKPEIYRPPLMQNHQSTGSSPAAPGQSQGNTDE